jgi:hypothetical protein
MYWGCALGAEVTEGFHRRRFSQLSISIEVIGSSAVKHRELSGLADYETDLPGEFYVSVCIAPVVQQ